MSQPLWQIKNISDTTIFTPDKGSVPAKRITFSVIGADDSYIDIPLASFTPDATQKLVHDMAVKIVDTLGLSGPMVNPSDLGIPGFMPPEP